MSGGGVVSGVALVAASAALAAAGSLLPVAGRQALAPRAVPLPEPATLMACPGAPVLTGSVTDSAIGAVGSGDGRSSTDPQFRAAPARTASTTWVLAPTHGAGGVAVQRLPAEAGHEAASTPAKLGKGTLAARVPNAGPIGVVTAPAADGPAATGALMLASTSAGDLRGLAASTCAEAAADSWLVGGATVLGRSARLVLDNPGPTPATVDVDVFTTTGVLAPPAGRDVVVPARERREVLLEGIAPDEPALALHVGAAGGRVAAFVVDSALRGLVPGGVDVVAPGAAPSSRQLVPAVIADDGAATTLRLAAPGGRDAVVSWRLLGVDQPGQHGQAPGGEGVTTVSAGTVLDVPLTGLAPGSYTAVVESGTPVLAAVQVLRGTPADDAPGSAGPDLERPTDVAWSPSVLPLGAGDGAEAVVPLPPASQDAGPAATATLVLGSAAGTAGASAVLRAVAPDGSIGRPQRIDVPAGTSVQLTGARLARRGATGLLISSAGTGELVAGLVLRDDDLISTVPVLPRPAPERTVLVRQAPAGAWP